MSEVNDKFTPQATTPATSIPEDVNFRDWIASIVEKITPKEAVVLGRFYKLCSGVVTSDEFKRDNPAYAGLNRTQALIKAFNETNEGIATICDYADMWKAEQIKSKAYRQTARDLLKLEQLGGQIDITSFPQDIQDVYRSMKQEERQVR